MNPSIIELGFWQMATAYIFILIVLVIVRLKGIPREKEILIATVRMSIQLYLTGYILVYIFENPHPLYTFTLIGIMEVFAVRNALKRIKITLPRKIKQAIAIAIMSGTLICICFFVFAVVQIDPWYDPRYFVPLSGMIVGNAMTGISLGVMRLFDGLQHQKDQLETALMLGAKPKVAIKPILNTAFDSAILPTINSMVGMGIVSLPGMMTGQILSGTSPLIAIAYQVAIMLAIAASVALTLAIFLHLAYRAIFNQEAQLVDLQHDQ